MEIENNPDKFKYSSELKSRNKMNLPDLGTQATLEYSNALLETETVMGRTFTQNNRISS